MAPKVVPLVQTNLDGRTERLDTYSQRHPDIPHESDGVPGSIYS